MGLDKSTTAGGRSSYEEMVKNSDFMIQAKNLFDKEDASMWIFQKSDIDLKWYLDCFSQN